jgi:hypothetical protein
MNWKKIIAKEIIYFFSIVILTFIIYSIVEVKNYYSENKSKKLYLAQISNAKKIDSLNGIILQKYRERQLIFNLTEFFEQGGSDEDGIKYSRDFKKMFGDKKKFKQIDDISKEQAQIKSESTEIQNNYVSNDINGFTSKSVLLFLVLLYPIRFSVILICWSIRTIKQ